MRRRLLGTYLTLLVVVLGVLSGPAATSAASRNTQTMFLDRVNDTVRFASLADTALRTGHTSALAAELHRYESVYGITAFVVGRAGDPVIASGGAVDTAAAPVRAKIDIALSGNRSATAGVVWPWQRVPLIVAEPIGRGGEVIGAALTVSPTAALRDATLRNWAALLFQGLLVLLVGALAAAWLTRWLLRPVHQLDATAHALTDAHGPGHLSRAAASGGRPLLPEIQGAFAPAK